MTLSSLLPFITVAAVVVVILGGKLIAKIRAERRHDRALSCACRNLESLTGTAMSSGSSLELARLSALRDHYYEQGATPEEWQALSREAETLGRRVRLKSVSANQ